MKKIRVMILGAAGMDFHIFNTVFRDNEGYDVIAFTMASEQNLGTVGARKRKYPPELAGELYPNGIPIFPETDMEKLIKEKNIDQVILAYSDISHVYVMHLASRVLASGADFRLIGIKKAMLKSKKPIVAICAVRTGCGKSQTSQKVCQILRKMGHKVVAIREPMPYGNLVEQACMRIATYEDMKKYKCTIEEREEYEAYIENDFVIYTGVDYGRILKQAEKEADIIVWDGGNNEISFYVPNLQIVVADPLRPGHEISYHPGEVNARIADVVIINKVNSAEMKNVEIVKNNIKKINPEAIIIKANSVVTVEDPEKVKGKKILVVEDGPTLTHGGTSYGAGIIAAKQLGCEIVDPRPYAVGTVKETYKNFPNLGKVLPAMGYSDKQIKELEKTINRAECDAVLVGTPFDLAKLLKINKPSVRVRYKIEEIGKPDLEKILNKFLKRVG